jgi:hypothetical protein
VLSAKAQFSNTYREAGIMAGPVFFKSDYGERGNFENFAKNSGYSIGGFYYLSAIEDYSSFLENFKVKLELAYCKSDLDHFGKWVEPQRHSITANQLRAMHGSTQVTSAGFQIEYYPLKTDDYYRGIDISPYIGFGPQLCYYTSKAWSDLGALDTPISTPPKYFNATRNGAATIGAVTGTIGARFKLSYYRALIAEVRTQYYFSDWVDGLNPDKNKNPENKHNDWNVWFNVGYIFYFQK